MKIRVDKLLANLGYGTRNEIHKLIRQGAVTIDGEIIMNISAHVDADIQTVCVYDEPVDYREEYYFMLNKPAGYLSATESDEPNVLDLIAEKIKGLFPCGRLDKDTEGLLLITTDGKLAHELLSPKYRIEKEYEAVLRDPLTAEQKQKIEAGIRYDSETVYRPCVINELAENTVRIIVTEGKYHEVKNMFSAAGNEVMHLKRIRMKDLILDESLAPGEYRELTEKEIEALRRPSPVLKQEA